MCGEKRITLECHIIPRSEGGPLHRDNFVMLCPLHHHLFDHARLSKDEWEILSSALVGKMKSAIMYANQVRLPMLQAFWREDERQMISKVQLQVQGAAQHRLQRTGGSIAPPRESRP